MAFRTLYKTLFQIALLHSYFLDDGSSPFLDMTDDEKEVQLRNYNFAEYLEIVPTLATIKELENHKLVMRQGTDSFRILNSVTEEDDQYRSKIFLSENMKLTFFIYKKDYLFDNYTTLAHEKNRLYYFSNIKPDTEADPYSYVPLGSTDTIITEDFLLTEESSRQLWYDIEQEDLRVDIKTRLGLMADLEDDDVDTDEGIEIIGMSIQREQGKGLLGIIQLQMLGDNDMDIIEIDDTDPDDIKNYLLDPTPAFKIHFDNRRTIWKYIKRSDDNELETVDVKPLTKNGFIEIVPEDDLIAPLPDDIDKYLFPNPEANIIKRVTDVNTNTTTTYSEIFI